MAKKAKPKRGARKGTIKNAMMNKRRKGILAMALPWFRRFGITLGVCTFALWIGAWLYLSGGFERAGHWSQQRFETISADAGFRVNNVLVEGRKYSDASVILAIVNVKKGDPLFIFNPQNAQDLIKQVSWVDDALVERRWPDTIYINITERKPLALLQSDKNLKLLDSKGEIIVTNNMQRFADLVMVSGSGAAEKSPELIGNLIAEPSIYERTETARRIGARRWDIRLKNKIEIQLPERDMGLALRRLSQAHVKDGLLDRDIISIDMREMDRISVKTKPGAIEEYKNGLKQEATLEQHANTATGNNI